MAIVKAFLALAAWYICALAPLRRDDPWRIVTIQGGAAAASSALWLLIGGAWSRALVRQAPGLFPADLFARQMPALFAVGLLLYLLSAAGHYLYLAFEASRRAESRALDLQLQAREAELRALRAQVDPHFLFNCLNSIGSLAATDPAAARRMCSLLADFLRAGLKLGRRDAITLDEEIGLATAYLAVEQVRFGARLKVEEEIDEPSRRCLVPPLLLQPLVENAVTHGIAHLVEGGIVRLESRLERGDVVIRLTNPVDPERPAGRGEGVGVALVRKRLATTYGNEARIDVREDEAGYGVELSLPARPVGDAAAEAASR
jgi:LytS/YehU family sensor histidine kinase